MGRTGGLLVVLGVLVIPLTGCALLSGPPGPDPSGSNDSASPTPTASPSATPTSAPDDIPFPVVCSELVSDEVIYEWGSGNWAADPDYTVAPGSSAAEIVEHGGTACGWVHLSSGEKLSVAIGEFAPETLAPLREEREDHADAVSDFGGQGYFAASGDVGQADVFTGGFWVSGSSTWFLTAGDALPIMQEALDAAD